MSLSLGQVTFTKSPENLQLFPRNSEDKTEVLIEGQADIAVFEKFSLIVKQDQELFKYNLLSLDKTNPTFSFKTDIFAKPVEYSFAVFGHKSTGDSLQVLLKEGIVCGDFYVLYGQSNLVALAGIDEFQKDFDDRLLRTFTFDRNNSLKWFKSKEPYGATGIVGLSLQKLILEKYGIPTCVINGAVGGASIVSLFNHDTSNTDVKSPYDQLYSRVMGAGAINNLKGIIWRQGENETCTWQPDIDAYPANFDKLFTQINRNFGKFTKFYNIQTNIQVCDNRIEGGGQLRDFMRRTKYLYNTIETLTSFGLPLSDHVHYTREGYEQTARELFGLIARDVYHSTDTLEVHPPDIKEIIGYFGGDTLILVFEKDQKLWFPEEIDQKWRLEDYFYLNSTTAYNSFAIEKGWAEGNKVFLKLKDKFWGGWLSYLPSYLETNPPIFPIHLKNSRGLRAFSFYQVPITVKFKDPKIVSAAYEDEVVTLEFEEPDNYVLEYAVDGREFEVWGKLIAANSYKVAIPSTAFSSLKFRIKRSYPPYESGYSNVVEVLSNQKKVVAQFRAKPVFEDEQTGVNYSIIGSNLGLEGQVLINSEKGQIIQWTDSLVVFNFPSALAAGNYEIQVVTQVGKTLILEDKIVILALPEILNKELNYYPVGYSGELRYEIKNLDIFEVVTVSKGEQWRSVKNVKLNEGSLSFNLPDGLGSGIYTLRVRVFGRDFDTPNGFQLLDLPVIERVNPTKVFESLKDQIEIAGNYFGLKPGKVFLGELPVEVLHWSENSVKFRVLDPILPGSYDVKLVTAHDLVATLQNGLVVVKVLANEVGLKPLVYPNPSRERAVVLQFSEKVEKVKAITLLGQTIELPFAKQNEGSYKVNIISLLPATYILQIHSNAYIFASKLVVE